MRIQLNQRIILNDSKGVIKYFGPVAGTSGTWIGIDWDNGNRGKHDGTFQGCRYFKASTSTSGSFIREQNLNFGKELYDEIVNKYADNSAAENDQQIEKKKKSGKEDGIHWELVKMDKIHKKQKEIFKLRCIVLSWSSASHIQLDKLAGTHFNVCTELDLIETLVGKWLQIMEILSVFPALRILHLSDNRIEPLEECTDDEIHKISDNLSIFKRITHLSLNRCRLTEHTANQIAWLFPTLKELYLAENGLTCFTPSEEGFSHLKCLDLQGNELLKMESVKSIFNLPSLEYLNLSSCQLIDVDFGNGNFHGFPQLKTLILQNNPISQWRVVDQLARLPSLNKLILKGTLLSGARGVDSREMIIAKIPRIIDLDRCDVSPVARRSAELLFLSRFSIPPVDEQHKGTVERLREIYELPKDKEDNDDNNCMDKGLLNGIKSRRISLIHRERRVERPLSLALPIHKVVGLAARLFDFDPDQIKSIELRRADPNFPAETLSRTKDNLLRQFELEDGDSIIFI